VIKKATLANNAGEDSKTPRINNDKYYGKSDNNLRDKRLKIT